METASVISSRSSNIGGKGRTVLSINDDPHTLTTFGNPFAEDEKEDTSFAYVSSLFSKVKNTFATVPSSTTATSTSTTGGTGSTSSTSPAATVEQSVITSPNPSRKGSTATTKSVVSFASTSRQEKGKGKTFAIRSSNPAPPLVSLTPVISEQPSFPGDNQSDAGSTRGGPSPSPYHQQQGGGEQSEGPGYGHFIPGFQLNDDARSIKTVASGRKSASASQVIRRLRGEEPLIGAQAFLGNIGWTTKPVPNATTARASSRLGEGNTIVVFVVGNGMCQIFCSRCASNIIKASRFGAEGMLRVCNLCLQKLEEEDDDEDDRRSVLSVSTNFPAHQLDLMHTGHHHASPYSTMHGGLPRSAETGHLYSIGEMRRRSSFDAFDSSSRPSSPADAEASHDQHWEDSAASHVVHPPFRRGLAEDERVPANPLEAFISSSPSSAVRPTLIASPVALPPNLPGQSSIAFPGSPGSSEGGHSPAPLRSRFNSYATEYDPTTGFGRNRVHSRLDLTGDLGEPGWRTRRESSAYAAELNAASMQHLRTMVRQMLAKERVPYQGEWEETLMKLALKVATHLKLSPRVFAMDARWYVKIKKLPGGAPRDSEYVDGAVITKNVAHKQMSRHIRQPRIMLVTFPFDYSRVEGQLMSIGPILAQEKEYLKNLTARVAAHHPHVLLVDGPVSRLALEYLLEKKIAVARSVKPKAIQFVSRITQSDIISSMDRLALEPRMGDCARFRLQTFEHALIPERRKTFMRFEGCSRETGCTIILRGGDVDTLKKVKKIASFVVFIVRNLKMETYLWKDHVLTLPPLTAEAAPDPFRPRVLSSSSMFTLSGLQPSNSGSSLHPPKSATFATPTQGRLSGLSISSLPRAMLDEDEDDESLDEDAQQRRLSHKIQTAIHPYLTTFISASATLRFPPPYPVRKMKELDDSLARAKKEWQEAEAAMIIKEEETHRQKADLEARAVSALDITLLAPGSNDATPTVDIGTPSKEPSALPGNGLEGLPPTGGASALLKSAVETPEPDDASIAIRTPMSILSDSASSSYFDQRRSITSETSLISSVLSSHKGPETQPPLPSEPLELKEVSCIAQDSQLAALRFEQQETQRLWEWYLRKNKDDFVVEHYQKITILTSTVPTVELDLRPPCIAPRLECIPFYGENDHTLGQVVEEACRNALENRPCSVKSCKAPGIQHSQIYIHNESRVIVSTQPWPAGTESKMVFTSPMDIVTFSFCNICGKNSPYIPMTEEARRYSFAKLLELHFYPADVRLLRGAGCFHNIYLHHIRYFAMNNGMAMQMQTEPVTVFEIVFPPMRTHVKPEELLELKNRDFAEMDKRSEEYWSSVEARVKQWESYVGGQADIAAQERGAPPLGTAVMELHGRLDRDRKEITDLIRQAYKESTPIDTLAVGPMRTAIQNKVVFYDNEFDRLEKAYFSFRNFLTTDKELKKLTGANLKRMYDFINGGTTSGVSEAEEKASYRVPAAQVLAPPSSASENESATDAEKASEPSQSEAEIKPVAAATEPAPPPTEEVVEAESDSTIGASRSQEAVSAVPEGLPNEDTMEKLIEEQETIPEESGVVSKLPRRAKPQNSVADLVKQFQTGPFRNELPISMPPRSGLVSESDQEIEVPVRRRTKSKGPTASLSRKPGSDAERNSSAKSTHRQAGYARRQLGQLSSTSRIPIPVPLSVAGESSHNEAPPVRPSSRPRHVATTPPKYERVGRGPLAINEELDRKGPHLPKHVTGKSHSRHGSSDRSTSRTAPSVPQSSKSNARRIPSAKGSNVTTLAKQFERLSRDSEKANRRYAIMKGRRARPVASSKAKVEIFDNLLDAARDDSEDGSEASSEADDEDEGDEFGKRKGSPDQQSLTDIVPEDSQAPPEPERLKIPDPTLPGSERDDYFDLTSPTVERPPPLEPEQRLPLAVVPGTEIITSRPASPLPDISPVAPISSSYQSNHSESEYSVGGGGERQSVINTMFGYSGFSWMREATPSFVHLKYPALPSEHLFEEAPIAVREDEPTSIIAFTLQSPGYLAALTKTKVTVKMSDRPEAFMPDNDGSVSDSQSWGIISLDGMSDAVNEIREPQTITHPVFHFESGGVQISCTVFHAEQFDALRRSCFCEQSMIESLARCVKWDASGGKSGSAFLKTRDNRFIAKELSRSELDAMSKFAPKYFQYMSDAISAKRPTLLAKIFGFYKIVYKNPVLGKTVRMTLLVMENLFYDHKACQVYDLKGSSRNRLAPVTSSNPNQVLLDENLLNNLHLAPMYIREHSKRVLRSALYSDSLFLEDLNVMDYSLLVAVDESKKEIIVGMIDYIRTYTWDKKLESWVKESTFLGGAGRGEPTIVTPKQYRTRFLGAMERYFFLVPDRWMKTTYTPEEDPAKDEW